MTREPSRDKVRKFIIEPPPSMETSQSTKLLDCSDEYILLRQQGIKNKAVKKIMSPKLENKDHNYMSNKDPPTTSGGTNL